MDFLCSNSICFYLICVHTTQYILSYFWLISFDRSVFEVCLVHASRGGGWTDSCRGVPGGGRGQGSLIPARLRGSSRHYSPLFCLLSPLHMIFLLLLWNVSIGKTVHEQRRWTLNRQKRNSGYKKTIIYTIYYMIYSAFLYCIYRSTKRTNCP